MMLQTTRTVFMNYRGAISWWLSMRVRHTPVPTSAIAACPSLRLQRPSAAAVQTSAPTCPSSSGADQLLKCCTWSTSCQLCACNHTSRIDARIYP